MPTWLPSYPYPPLKKGYWEPVTSTINWCEEDYYATIYSAEIVNSVTNMLFQALAVKGALNCIKHEHDQVFLVAFIASGIVGTGSLLFHSTLRYTLQLVDELAMLYTSTLMVYATLSHNKSLTTRIWLATSLAAIAISVTLYYHWLQEPVFHQVVFAILTAFVLNRSMWVMEANLRPTYQRQKAKRAKLPAQERKRQETRDAKILREMWILVGMGHAIFLGGFAIWNLDNIYCSNLRRWRHELGLPWGILLEFHGWWHLMTGTGAYYFVVWGLWLRHCLNGRQDEYRLHWPSRLFSLPSVVKNKPPVGQNGAAKKRR